jgi:hypothetical protein
MVVKGFGTWREHLLVIHGAFQVPIAEGYLCRSETSLLPIRSLLHEVGPAVL